MTGSSDSLSVAGNNSSLNNKNNPFIKASKKFNNQKYKTLLKEKDKDKEKNEKDNDSENKPPKYFNILKAKLLKTENIEKKQKNGDEDNYWYTELIFNGKKFKKMTKNKKAKNPEYIHY